MSNCSTDSMQSLRTIEKRPRNLMTDNCKEQVLIIGASFTGFSAAASLPSCSVILIDKAHAVGEGSPFRSSPCSSSSSSLRTNLGAAVLSMNMSEAKVQSYIGKITRSGEAGTLEHVDDGLLSKGKLSRTSDRPQGWNRVFGQWEHYTLAATDMCSTGKVSSVSQFLSSLVDDKPNVSIQSGREAVSIEEIDVAPGKRRKWKVTIGEGSQDNPVCVQTIEATTVIICTPAAEALRLLRLVLLHVSHNSASPLLTFIFIDSSHRLGLFP